MEQRRYLRCLGQPALFAPTGEPIRLRTKKHLALLIYVAVEDRSHRRDRLAEMLWPNVSPSEARHSLATALSTLRPRLGPDGLDSSRDHVRLAAGRVTLDLERLESGDVLGSEITGPLEVAAFLDGFDIPESAEFTHWKDRQQARFLPMIKDALVVLIDRCRRTGDSRQIERLADRMLALDDLSEEAIRAKMEARAFAGDRLTALEIFEEWRAKLAEELKAVPSDLVEGMAVRLRRRGWERTTLPKIPNVPTDQWRGRPFIGRAAEYRVLYETWEDARRGIPHHALILGDSGVGKSTLAGRLTTAAGLQGAAISRVQCYDVERDIPYSTLSGLFLGLLDRPGASSASPESLAELSRTIPEVRHRFPNLPTSVESHGENSRIRLTEALLELLSAVSEEHPVILVIDDLHLADDVSLAVLHLIMRRLRQQPVMILLISRPGEMSQSSQATRLRESVVPLSLNLIELMPLNESEAGEMLTSLLLPDESQPTASEQKALLRAASGFPMVLELLVQDWKASGQHSLALSVDAMTFDCATGGPAKAAYAQIFERMTRSLDTTTQSVLNLASILGRRLSDFGLYAIADLSTGQSMNGMAELVQRRVLRDGAQGLEFVNELVRAAAYVSVPSPLRRALHSSIADRFIRDARASGDRLGLEIAWHSIRAGRIVEATPYLLRGAREAIQSGAPGEAERGLATALPHLTGSDKSDALVLLAEALQEQSRWEESIAYLDQLVDGVNPGSTDLAFVLRAKAQRRLGRLTSSELSNLPRSLLAFVKSAAKASSRLKAAVEAASVFDLLRGKHHLTAELIDVLSDFKQDQLDTDDAAHLLLARAMLLYNSKDFEGSLSHIDKAREMLESNGSPNSVLAMLYNGIGAIRAKRGDYEGSVAAYRVCQQTALRVGNDSTYLQACANLALSLSRLGRYDEAIHWSEKPLEYRHSDIATGFLFQAAQSALLSWSMLGKTDRAEELTQSSRERFARCGSPGILQGWALYTADAYAILGKTKEAHEEGARGTEGLNAPLHMDFYAGPYARWLARTCGTTESMRRAQEVIEGMSLGLGAYDRIDQAEILNARCLLRSKINLTIGAEFYEMLKALRALPDTIIEIWRRLGILEFDNPIHGLSSVLPEASCRPTHAF